MSDELLEDVPIGIKQRMVFIADGAAHFSKIVRNYIY